MKIYSTSQPNLNRKNPQTHNQPSFRGKLNGRNVGQLYEEYNWLINVDKEQPIRAFLKMEDTPEAMDNFFTAIITAEDRGMEMVRSITQVGKDLFDLTNNLYKKLGKQSQNLYTFMPTNPYRQAYTKYMITKFDQAHSIEEILRIRPDWREDALMGKYQRLKGNDNFKIGKIPCEFPKEARTFEQIMDYLKPFMQEGYKLEQSIPDLKIGNRTYRITSFADGKSDKNVFCVTVPEGKSFVFKIGTGQHTGLNDEFGLGTLSLIDTYLTTNRSVNSAPLRFYDKKRDVSIYSFIEHAPVELGSKPSIEEVNKRLSDFKRLGLRYNDTVGSNNYFWLKDVHKEAVQEGNLEKRIADGEWISVDNDHVTYESTLHPQIRGLNKSLPNAMNFCC